MDCYQILNLIISSFAAIGTVTATIVALYLANRQEPVRLRVRIYQAIVTGGSPWPKYLAISIINRSKVPVQVDGLGWTLPKTRRGLSMMLVPSNLYEDLHLGARIPFYLASGQKSSTFMIPWDEFKNMFENMMQRDSDGILHEEVKKGRISFYVSTPLRDRNLQFNMENRVLEAIMEAAKVPYEPKN